MKGALAKAVEKDGAKQLDKTLEQLDALASRGSLEMPDEDLAFDDEGLNKWTDEDRFEVTRERLVEYAKATNDPIPAHLAGEVAPPVFAIVPVFESLLTPTVDVAPVELIRTGGARRAGLSLPPPDPSRRQAGFARKDDRLRRAGRRARELRFTSNAAPRTANSSTSST